MKIDRKFSESFFLSLVLFIVLCLFVIPYLDDMLKLFNANIFYLILVFFAFYLLILLSTYFIKRTVTFEISENKIKKTRNIFQESYIDEDEFDAKKSSIEIKRTFIDKLLRECTLKIYSKEKGRILSVRLKDDELYKFESNILKTISNERHPYRKSISFEKDVFEFLSILLNTFLFLFLFGIVLTIIVVNTSLKNLSIFNLIINPYITIILYLFEIYLVITASRISSVLKTELKIKDETVYFEKGRLINRKFYFNKENLDSVLILSGPLDKYFKYCMIRTKLSRNKYVHIPASYGNANSFVFNVYKEKEYTRFNFHLFLFETLIFMVLSLLIFLLNHVVGISLFILLVFVSLSLSARISSTSENGKYVFYNGFIIQKHRIVKCEDIRRIKYIRITRNIIFVFIKYDKGSIVRVLSREDILKLKMGED